MTQDEINSILYSVIRNEKHLKVRRKGYLHQTFRLIYIMVFKRKTVSKFNKNKVTVINDAPSNVPLDIGKLGLNELVLSYKNPFSRTLLIIEIFLNLAFLIRIKICQKTLMNLSGRLTKSFLNRNNVGALVCGHPTILMTFLGFFLKKKNGYVITVQHGIYSLGDYKVLWFEKEVASHVLVYGEYFKMLYQEQGVISERVKLGSPYFTSLWGFSESINTDIEIKKRKVLFLGQQLYKISEDVFNSYNDFLEDLITFYKTRNIDVCYKPHPRESLNYSLNKRNLNKLKIILNRENIDNYDIYYSVNSSLLIELYLQKKVCFQVDIPISDFKYDFFHPYTGIPSINIDAINSHLTEEKYIFWYDENYINLQEKNTMSLEVENILSKFKELSQ